MFRSLNYWVLLAILRFCAITPMCLIEVRCQRSEVRLGQTWKNSEPQCRMSAHNAISEQTTAPTVSRQRHFNTQLRLVLFPFWLKRRHAATADSHTRTHSGPFVCVPRLQRLCRTIEFSRAREEGVTPTLRPLTLSRSLLIDGVRRVVCFFSPQPVLSQRGAAVEPRWILQWFAHGC